VVAGQGEDCSGIFTERDVMRALARNGTHILDEPVAKHMTDRPQSILPTTSIDEAMEIMTEKRFRHLPVIAGTTLCGIVSIGDLVNYRIHQTEMEASALKEYIATG
jgi:CBS domain-containing protein